MENIKEQFARLYMELDLTDDQAAMIKKLQKDVDAALRQPPVGSSTSLANQLMEDKWWCPTCNEWVSPRDVTYEETHDKKSGGCGNAVE